MGRHKYLVLDSRIVDRVERLRLAPGQVEKDRHNPLFLEDKPWETRFDNLYANVIWDEEEGLFKCWYSPFIVSDPEDKVPHEERSTTRYTSFTSPFREMAVCYATSRDGIVWDKPELGQFEFKGSTANNMVLRLGYGAPEDVHGAGIAKDPRDPDPGRRYKMFFKHGAHMAVAFSPDGLHWGAPIDCPEIQSRADTHNNAFWAPTLGKYVGISRAWDPVTRVRQVCRTESPDFIHWTRAEVVLQGLDRAHQVYAMITFPYAGTYLGLAMIFNSWTDLVHCELAWSPDTVTWHRVCPGTPLIPRGSDESHDWGCIYAAAYPIWRQDEIWLYYGGNNGRHTNWRDGSFCLAHLRPDGFAGYEPEQAGEAGALWTQAVACGSASLRVSADARGGSLRVALLDPAGRELASSEPIADNVTDSPVRWQAGNPLAGLVGQPVRLRFELRDAKLYSFSFGG